MGAVELLVAVAGDDERRHRFGPAGHQPQHVKRRLVRPMDVLEHQDRRRRRLELAQQRCRDVVRLRPPFDVILELAAASRAKRRAAARAAAA